MAAPASSKPKAKRAAPAGPSPLARVWLILYNVISFYLWALVLSVTLKHLALGPHTATAPARFAEQLLAPLRPLRGALFAPRFAASLPAPLRTLLERSCTLHAHVGGLVALTQSLAVLEILHAATGLVRSPVPTTTIQVFSRLLLVWGVSERFDAAATSPFYASMILAWSITECVRYPFYASQLMGSEAEGLLWARYTLFYVLYPLGAGSEAQLMFSTLPRTWFWAKGGAAAWSAIDYLFLALYVTWWPGLYVMYTHMIRQRRRALGKGFWGDKRTQIKVAEKQRKGQ